MDVALGDWQGRIAWASDEGMQYAAVGGRDRRDEGRPHATTARQTGTALEGLACRRDRSTLARSGTNTLRAFVPKGCTADPKIEEEESNRSRLRCARIVSTGGSESLTYNSLRKLDRLSVLSSR